MDAEEPDPRDHPEAAGEVDGSTEPEDAGPGSTALPPKVEAWRRRSAAGAILTGFALGLQQALEKQREDPTITVQTSGDPPDDLPVEADFEYGRPRHSVVSIRPWLLPEGGADGGTEGGADGEEQREGRPPTDEDT